MCTCTGGCFTVRHPQECVIQVTGTTCMPSYSQSSIRSVQAGLSAVPPDPEVTTAAACQPPGGRLLHLLLLFQARGDPHTGGGHPVTSGVFSHSAHTQSRSQTKAVKDHRDTVSASSAAGAPSPRSAGTCPSSAASAPSGPGTSPPGPGCRRRCSSLSPPPSCRQFSGRVASARPG